MLRLVVPMASAESIVDHVMDMHAEELKARQQFMHEILVRDPAMTVEALAKAMHDKFEAAP